MGELGGSNGELGGLNGKLGGSLWELGGFNGELGGGTNGELGGSPPYLYSYGGKAPLGAFGNIPTLDIIELSVVSS